MQSSSIGYSRKNPDGSTTQGVNWDDFYQRAAAKDSAAQKYGFKNDQFGAISDSSSGSGGSGGSSSNSSASGSNSNLFGNIGELGSTFNQFADQNISRAKDWAQFQLGLNAQQGEQDYGFRNREATRDFGFQTALAGQQIEGNKSLESLRQNSETDRLQRSLTSQQNMQQADFSNQTQQRAQQAALARIGFSGR